MHIKLLSLVSALFGVTAPASVADRPSQICRGIATMLHVRLAAPTVQSVSQTVQSARSMAHTLNATA